MVVNDLYYGPVWRDTIAPIKAEASTVSISDEIIAAALRNIYRRDFNPHDDIEPNLFNTIAQTLGSAVTEGFSAGSGSAAAPSLGQDPFLHALRHSTDVFAAFKTHRAQNDMAARLLDSNGNLKPFKQWKEEVLPIASHQCNNWLETEYNTAVLRARQAANWQQFQREKDILPNLKWLPSTSPNPGADHRLFWNTILPVDHPFWDQHRPGDRWNCKCDLTSTDEQPTDVPSVATQSQPQNTPQSGLKSNPGKTAEVFSDDHPYFPTDCRHCAFYKPGTKARLQNVFTARVKDCYNCPYINGCIGRVMEKKQIDETAFARKKEVEEQNLMSLPVETDIQFENISTGTLHLSGKSRGRFLKHAHHDYDVIAAVYAWNHPESLSFIEPSALGEGKDMNNPDDVRNINKKWRRGVRGYLKYRLTHNGRNFIIKTEKLKWGNEQFYSIIEE
ncbi:MAG: hypothetical protein IJ624_02715 [Prevotella sp.]|nr:hypothetical protein [Prevotella sp.]